MVFIGDTIEDYESSQEVNVSFIGRNSKKPFEGININLYEDLSGIKEHILSGNLI